MGRASSARLNTGTPFSCTGVTSTGGQTLCATLTTHLQTYCRSCICGTGGSAWLPGVKPPGVEGGGGGGGGEGVTADCEAKRLSQGGTVVFKAGGQDERSLNMVPQPFEKAAAGQPISNAVARTVPLYKQGGSTFILAVIAELTKAAVFLTPQQKASIGVQ
jgi:hypothetical protein